MIFPYDSCAGYQRQLSVLLVNRVPVETVLLLAKCTGIGEGEGMLVGSEREGKAGVWMELSARRKRQIPEQIHGCCVVFISLTSNFHPQPLFDHN